MFSCLVIWGFLASECKVFLNRGNTGPESEEAYLIGRRGQGAPVIYPRPSYTKLRVRLFKLYTSERRAVGTSGFCQVCTHRKSYLSKNSFGCLCSFVH